MVSTKVKNRVINSLRRLTFSHPPRNQALNKMKVAAATFACEKCGDWYYSGKSEKNLAKIEAEFPDKDIQVGKVYVDHIEPIVPLTGWESWDSYIERMFCEKEGLQILCEECHDVKTRAEKKKRVDNRKKK